MRFLADMGVSPRVVDWLREQGHEASHLREERLNRLPDHEVFSKAISEDRVGLAFDLDFGEIAALSRGRSTSVILFRLRDTRTSHVIERLSSTIASAGEALANGSVVIVEETRVRVRALPIRKTP